MGRTTIIHGKKGYIKNLENFDPYIKVINIETKFPSSFVVHLRERQEVYAIEFDNGHYICDEELRVLRISDAYSPSQDNAILLNFEGIEIKGDLVAGEYIDLTIPEIYSSLYSLNRPLGEQKAMIESITFSTEYDNIVKKDQHISTLKFYSGQTFKIINDSYGLSYKLKLMNDVYCQLYDFVGKTITDSDKNQILLTEENIKDCTIIINNYYNYTKYSEKDCYFDIIIK